jgi:O-antigen biosynthesis protein
MRVSKPDFQFTPSTTPIAVRTIELSEPGSAPQPPILGEPIQKNISSGSQVRVFGLWQGIPVGWVDWVNDGTAESLTQLETQLETTLKTKLETPIESPPLPPEISVSLVIATCDRPNALSRCLTSLVSQNTMRSVEILVVDNRPDSGKTRPVIDRFPQVRYLAEPRRGGSFARNTGFTTSRGAIIISVDDDVTVPQDWLERLIAPLARPEIGMVTGNLLPMELETRSQQLFEHYGNGGLGRGFAPFEVDRAWFQSRKLAVPTWELGATANLAFRREILEHPQVGGLDCVLGPGMPCGGGEDLYWFYQVLKAGYGIAYEPNGWGWHQHRSTIAALEQQIFNYGKANIAYHLTVLTRHGDLRVLPTLLIFLPIYFLKRLIFWLLGDRDYPLNLMRLEISGILAGPWGWWRSHQMIRRMKP